MGFVDASTRYCPGCGGPNADRRAHACAFCHGPLVPLGTPDPRTAVRCRACAASTSAGASYCPSCGDPLAADDPGLSPHTCPGCGASPMQTFGLSPTVHTPTGRPVHGCRQCGGAWADTATLQQLLQSAAAEAQTRPTPSSPDDVRRRRLAPGKVVYRRCAVCGEHMHRRNFARVSGVIVDECRTHGTFFDAGELEDVLHFVRSGGMALAGAHEAAERERNRRHLAVSPTPRTDAVDPSWVLDGTDEVDLVAAFVRWASRWLGGRS